MAILSKTVGIVVAAAVGVAAGAALGQSTPVLTGAAVYGDWRSDAPGVRRRISPEQRLAEGAGGLCRRALRQRDREPASASERAERLREPTIIN